jgi:hypothetical protein
LIVCAAMNIAQAAIILSGSDVIGGAGFGNLPRILTIQVTGNGSTESGCNAWNGSQMTVGPGSRTNAANAGGHEPNPHGFPKDSTPTLGSLNFTQASDIGLIFDATEPGNKRGNPLTMNSLILKFYSAGGVLLPLRIARQPALGVRSNRGGQRQDGFPVRTGSARNHGRDQHDFHEQSELW